MKKSVTAAAFFAMLASLYGLRAAEAQNVVTYHNTPGRSGDFQVPGLTFAAASRMHPDKGFHTAISGNVYAQPLYWQQAAGKPKLLIVATQSNTVYALNADTGATVWRTQLATPVPKGALPCGDISPEGITGTPVIDPASGRLYLDASTLQSGNLPRHMIYALSLATGKVVPHFPVNVDNAMAVRHASFSSEIQGQRSALQFFKGKLYITYAGRAGDCGNYHGAVIEMTPTAVPKVTGDWQTRAVGGGIWAQGGAPGDGTSLFVTTGNTFDANNWGDGEAIFRLAPGLAHSLNPMNYFVPSAWKALDFADNDLGGTAAIPIKVASASGPQSRILALGKDGNAYLVNGSNMGGIGHALAIRQVSNHEIISAPAVYETATGTMVIFNAYAGLRGQCSGTDLTALKVTTGKTPVAISWCINFNGQGAPIVTTTNGTADPIVWVAGAEGDNELHGFNALTGGTVFAGGGAGMTGLHRFGSLIAANRHLYVAGDNQVYAFTF